LLGGDVAAHKEIISAVVAVKAMILNRLGKGIEPKQLNVR